MSTPLQDVIDSLRQEWAKHEGQQTDPLSVRSTVEEGTLRGTLDGDGLAAPIDIDRQKTSRRDRLTPAVPIQLGTYSLAASTSLLIPLPRNARQIVIQNNSDLGGNAGSLYITWGLAPATT